MAKKTKEQGGGGQGAKAGRKLAEAARKHQDALMAQGLSATVLDKFENALSGLEGQSKGPNPAAQTLVKDLQTEVGEIHAAIKKEFPGSAQFQGMFKANEPIPQDPREVLALARLVAAEAPNFASNLIRYAINAATVKHLTFLCDQLEKELGGADPKHDARALEEQIREAARRAFEGKPELADFGG
jgi:hypothetical protein